MKYTEDLLLDDLSAFADLGTGAPHIVVLDDTYIVRMTREGIPVELTFSPESVRESSEGQTRKHASLAALLASPTFANLGKWADSQKLSLADRVKRETIPIVGKVRESGEEGGIELIDKLLAEPDLPQRPRTSVLLIDGPAGIGKTGIIRFLAYNRAVNYRRTQRALLLHVESRGRVLQNLTDLMAFSLQTLRLGITYDQVPALVRNGLVVLAIDGFDELGDPNGYGLAWAQVNDLIASSRGAGALILAGRETFIGQGRVKQALTALDDNLDHLATYTIQLIRPTVARQSLSYSGWSEQVLNSSVVAPLFEPNSYALRPFFLRELGRSGVDQQIERGDLEDLLLFLMSAMTTREASKFGRDVDAISTLDSRRDFVCHLMEEVARDMAENQTDSISSETLSWLAEIAAHETIGIEVAGILKNRAGVIAFLTDDDRRGYKRFVHEQVLNYFLSNITIKAVSNKEVPKYIRRNIFGFDFLESFASACRYLDISSIDNFIAVALSQMDVLGDMDRSRQNLASLVLVICGVTVPSSPTSIKNVSIDEVYLSETVSDLSLFSVTIRQLYAMDADLRSISFEEGCFIVSIIADDSTFLPLSIPTPSLVNLPASTLVELEDKEAWIIERYRAANSSKAHDTYRDMVGSWPLFALLDKIARYKPYWLRKGDGRAAQRILDDPRWDTLRKLLMKHNLLVERFDIQAAGRPGPFYHLKNRKELLLYSDPPPFIEKFVDDLWDESVMNPD